MTVAELIAALQAMPPELPVVIPDETGVTYHWDVDTVEQKHNYVRLS